ncbi:MAG: hypothetical protein HND52_14520 [Ignavibacteriae bacterium]|nr:hypothetical protein [Ignavibacteriota bacterium]NOG99168.1 hypothetical protein [Ignavibacteriota bacterium]
MKRLFFLIFTAVIFSSCSKSTMFIMPEYEDLDLPQQTLAIVPFDIPPVITNDDDITDDFGEGDVDEIYRDLIEKGFKSALNKYSSIVNFKFVKYDKQIETEYVQLGKDEDRIKFKLPKHPEIIEFESFEADFILFIKDWVVSRVSSRGVPFIIPVGQGVTTGGGSSSDDLTTKVRYAIWDNKNHKVVSYGKIVSEIGVLFAMTEQTWYDSFDDVVRQIMTDTPFEKEYYYGR